MDTESQCIQIWLSVIHFDQFYVTICETKCFFYVSQMSQSFDLFFFMYNEKNGVVYGQLA